MRKILCILTLLLFLGRSTAFGRGAYDEGQVVESDADAREEINVQQLLFEHILDSYVWEICKIGDHAIALYLPVILHSKTTGWHLFSSKRLSDNGGNYEGFYPAPEGSAHAGKLMELMPDGSMVRPLDLSITKISAALMFNSLLLILLILPAALTYRRRRDGKGVPGKYSSFVEMVVMMIEDSVIKPCVGENYRVFSPYLLTVFFFIFLNNIMALIPIFPAGVGVTANITITMALAICTFIAVNVFGTRTYWRDILWPEVPLWLKAPIPMLPLIELVGIFTKPIALMIRLFANMLSGHMAMLVLTLLIFIGFSVGTAIGTSMTVISVLFNVFMNALEILVAFIQAYVFTLLSAVFIGGAQVRHAE